MGKPVKLLLILFLTVSVSSAGFAQVPKKTEKQESSELKKTSCKKFNEERKQIESGDKGDSNSPSFRYIIVVNVTDLDLAALEETVPDDAIPIRRYVDVLMEKEAFNEKNLIHLFSKLVKRFPEPIHLEVTVHTSLLTIETPEEMEAVSTHSSRVEYFFLEQSATYYRFDDCSASFEYSVCLSEDCPPGFSWKSVNLLSSK